jgi:hypothetical protein
MNGPIKWSASAASAFSTQTFHGGGAEWDSLIATTGEVERIRRQSMARKH